MSKGRMTKRDRYLRRTYGITERQYNAKLRAQHHSCALCGKHKSNFTRRLAVDHNHKTGVVRGLCCFQCNKYRIGRNNLASAKALYEYMVKYEGSLPGPQGHDTESPPLP